MGHVVDLTEEERRGASAALNRRLSDGRSQAQLARLRESLETTGRVLDTAVENFRELRAMLPDADPYALQSIAWDRMIQGVNADKLEMLLLVAMVKLADTADNLPDVTP